MADVPADTDSLRREVQRLERRARQRRDGSSLAMIDLDGEGAIVGWNREAERLFGWRAAEVVGRSFAVLVPGPAPQQVAATAAMLADVDRPRRDLNVRKDGSTILCHWHNHALRDEDGALDCIYCEVREVRSEAPDGRREQLMQALADRSPLGIFAKDPDGRYIYANHEFARSIGRAAADVLGRNDFDLFTAEIAASLRRHDAEIVAAGSPRTREDRGVGPDSDRTYWSLKFPLHDAAGEVTAVCGIVNDITSLRRSEQERAALQQQVIAELSTPLLPLAEGVLAMPLIGAIDGARARLIMAALLEGVAQRRARAVILDVTGVRTVDAAAADALVQAARAVRLLGAEPIVTGIHATVADVLVQLGVDLRGIVTLGSLRGGVEHAIQRSRPGRPR